jgi:hypothetical protein
MPLPDYSGGPTQEAQAHAQRRATASVRRARVRLPDHYATASDLKRHTRTHASSVLPAVSWQRTREWALCAYHININNILYLTDFFNYTLFRSVSSFI